MSPRAAWRLDSLGFQQVYDYVAGEADWFASGLPREGRDAAIPMKPSTAMNVAYEFSVVSALGTFLQAKSRVWMADHEPS